MLYQYLRSRSQDVVRFLPDRRKDGYGLSKRAVDWAMENDVGLLITVDCGTSDGDLTEKLIGRGIEVIICDHHEFPPGPPPRGIMLNPIRADEVYPFRHLSGAGVAFKLIQALERKGFSDSSGSDDFLDLMAMATVGDLSLLIGENRYFVRRGLEAMSRSLRPGLEALRQVSNLKKKEFTARHISFVFAPRLNAPGRVSNAKPALELLCSEDGPEARRLSLVLERENERRKEYTETVRREVESLIDDMPDGDDKGGYILASQHWDEGVLGIAASRIVETTSKPTILMSVDGELAKGSGRSVKDINLKEQLDLCRHHLVKYGGHAQAIGLTIKTDRIAEFEKEMSDRLRQAAAGKSLRPELTIDADLNLEDCSMELIEFLDRCEPFGYGNKQPVWRLKNMTVESRSTMVGGNHLKLFFHDSNGRPAEAISFNWRRPEGPAELAGHTLDLAVTITKGYYLERYFPEIRIVDLKPSGRS
jgi:single-stranded-DNA-specific exonuclease